MSTQFDQQRLSSVINRNMQKFKMLVGNKERKFNDLIKPFTKLETFIDAKSVLKSIAKPHKSELSQQQQDEENTKVVQNSEFIKGDFNTDLFYTDIDNLIQKLENEQRDTITIGQKRISRNEIFELKKKHPNYTQQLKLFNVKSNKVLARLNHQSTRIFNKKYSLANMSPKENNSNYHIMLNQLRDQSFSKYSQQKTQQFIFHPHMQKKLHTESKIPFNYNDQIQQLITKIDNTHKKMTDETDSLTLKTTRFITNQSKSNKKIKQFDYLFGDNTFAFTKIKKRII